MRQILLALPLAAIAWAQPKFTITDLGTVPNLGACIATAISGERVGIGAFSDESIRDPRLLALADRVGFSVDATSRYPETFPGWVRVRLRDGGTMEAREESQRGGPDRPIGADEVIAKFRDNAARALPPDRAACLERGILALEGAGELSSLMALCRVG